MSRVRVPFTAHHLHLQTSHNLHNLQLSKAVGFFLLSVGKAAFSWRVGSVDKMKSKQVGYCCELRNYLRLNWKRIIPGMSLFLLYTICHCIDRGSCVLRRVFPMCCAQRPVSVVYDGVKLWPWHGKARCHGTSEICGICGPPNRDIRTVAMQNSFLYGIAEPLGISFYVV